MRRAWAEASRTEGVREAARGWKAAGVIDEATLAAIQAEYPDPRIALHRAWQVLVFVIASIAIATAFAGIFRGSLGLVAPSLFFALLLGGATERLRGSKLSGTGTDAATSFWALTFLLTGIATALDAWHLPSEAQATLLLAISGLVGILAAWRWGFWFFAGAGAASLGLAVARAPGGRWAWIVLSMLVMAATYRRLGRASIAPAHRHGLAAVFAVAASALYAALNLYSLDEALVERVRHFAFGRSPAPGAVPATLRGAAALLTAAFPALFLAWGIRARRRLLLAIGIVAAALSVATLRHYAPIGPRWAFLTACGAMLVGAALWIHRRLRDAPGAAWRGLTARPLHSPEAGGLSPLGALGATIAVPGAPEPDRGNLSTGGGEFGGGGASGQF